MGLTGCDELAARRKIQDAGKLYQVGEFEKAAAIYEQVLETVTSGEVAEVAHYNAGITYNKLFRPGVETPENLKIAKAATEHFAKYLVTHPKDSTVVSLMTQVWMNSGDYESALQYWQKEHAKDPKNGEVIAIVAGIYRQAGDWEKSVEWHYKEAEATNSTTGKADAYMNVGKLTSNMLFNRAKLVWFERLKVADVGLEALQKAEPLVPENPDLQTYMGILYSLRSEAHQASWAQVIDKSNGRYHHGRSAALRKAAEPPQPEQPATAQDAGTGAADAGVPDSGAQEASKATGDKPAGGAATQPAKPAEGAAAQPPASPAGGASGAAAPGGIQTEATAVPASGGATP